MSIIRRRYLDTVNWLEEIEDIDKSEQRAIESNLVVVLLHLLKYKRKYKKVSLLLKIMNAYTIDLKPVINCITDRDFERLCASNPELRLETDASGKLIVMPPTGNESGKLNGDLFFQVKLWNRHTKLGVVFDSSTGFKLSNGAIRSPDVSWIAINRWNSLTIEQKRGFAPIDPNFVIELMSPTDNLLITQQKMAQYMNCGIELGWLINPDEKQVEIYRIEGEKQIINNLSSLSGENILPELTVDLADIF